MVKLRLQRTGRKKMPSYRVVAIDSKRKRDGSYLEKVGHYYPLMDKFDVDQEKVCKWLTLGAQPTAVVKSILKKTKTLIFCQKAKEKT